MKRLIIASTILVNAVTVLFSAEALPAKTALLIANGNYATFGVLEGPIREAEELSKALVSIGFEVTVITNATKATMQEALLNLSDQVNQKGGIAFFHYGGHAVQIQGKNYLLPVDASIRDESRVKIFSLDVDEVTETLNSSRSDATILILDSCRDNPFPSATRSATRGMVIQRNSPKNSVIIYSAESGSTAIDGIFTPILSKEITKPVSFSEVIQSVRKQVYTVTNGQQIPGAYDQLLDPIFLAGRASISDIALRPLPSNPVIQSSNVLEKAREYQRQQKLEALTARLKSLTEVDSRRNSLRNTLQVSGWTLIGGGIAGAGLSTWAYINSENLRTQYNAAPYTADFNQIRSDLQLTNTLFNVGVGTLITGALSGVVTLLFSPAESSHSSQEIHSIESQIQELKNE